MIQTPLANDAGVGIERVEYAAFREGFRWRQGEHITCVGPTGSGKTTTALDLLDFRTYPVILATKPKDETLEHFARTHDYKIVRTASLPPVSAWPRVIVWPDVRQYDKFEQQRAIFERVLVDCYEQGGRCVYVDEAYYVAVLLGLPKPLEVLWQQGRSLGVSLVVGTQRPKKIPLSAYDQPTHLFFWRDTDAVNLQRISEISGPVDKRAVADAVQSLTAYHDEKGEPVGTDFLYVNTRTGEMLISRADVEGKG